MSNSLRPHELQHSWDHMLVKLRRRFFFFKYFHWCQNLEKIEQQQRTNKHTEISLLGSVHCFSQFSSVAQSCLTLWNPIDCRMPRPPCPSPTPRAYSNSCPLSRWCHPTASSSVIPLSSCLQSFPESQSFPVNQLFASGGQSIGVSASASVLSMNIQN